MPVLGGAESIDVLSVEGAMVPGPSAAEIAESLRSHGLNVTSQHVKPGNRSAGQTIVDTAVAGGADLIVKGMEGAIAAKTVTYDFARLMDNPTEVKCSEFGDAIIKHM